MASREQINTPRRAQEESGLTVVEKTLLSDKAAILHQARIVKPEDQLRYSNAWIDIVNVGARGLPVLWGALSETVADVLAYEKISAEIRESFPDAPPENPYVLQRIAEAKGIELHAVLDEKTENAIEHANAVPYAELGIEPTAVPAVKLYLFNKLRQVKDGDAVDTTKEIEKVRMLSRAEKEAAVDANPLPTIGTELEIPNYASVQLWGKKVLDRLAIPNYWERHDLLEANPDYTYTALAQARILEELSKAGMIRFDLQENYALKVPEEEMLSLHVNLGIPKSISENISIYDEAILLSDIVTLAFVSPYRIINKKTKTTESINTKRPANPSKKDSARTSVNNVDSEVGYSRLELRAGEFRDYPTFRMLTEVQRLGGMLLATMKREKGLPMSVTEEGLAKLWDSFTTETEQYLKEIKYTSNMAYSDQYRQVELAAELAEDGKIKSQCRHIVTKYSQEVARLLKVKE